jgi:hypothetical protein
MTGGMIVGGWEYVYAAYAVTLTVLGVYAGSVIVRLRAESKREQEEP